MRREDILDLVGRLQPTDVTKLVFVLTGGRGVITDMIFRTDPEYLVIRGRETGTNDEARAFFVPYSEVVYLRLERVVKVNDLKRMYGLPLTEDAADEFESASDNEPTTAAQAATPGPAKAAAQDPATIAKQNLLDRIRAARTSAGSSKPTATK
jgi:hypothetical protein